MASCKPKIAFRNEIGMVPACKHERTLGCLDDPDASFLLPVASRDTPGSFIDMDWPFSLHYLPNQLREYRQRGFVGLVRCPNREHCPGVSRHLADCRFRKIEGGRFILCNVRDTSPLVCTVNANAMLSGLASSLQGFAEPINFNLTIVKPVSAPTAMKAPT